MSAMLSDAVDILDDVSHFIVAVHLFFLQLLFHSLRIKKNYIDISRSNSSFFSLHNYVFLGGGGFPNIWYS